MNLGSKAQLSRILFDVLKHPCRHRTKPSAKFPNGQPKVDKTVLQDIKEPFVQRLLKVEDIKSLRRKLQLLRRETINGRFHPNFNLHTVKTYRSSSGKTKDIQESGNEFNFQNIPVRDPKIAEVIRSCFLPDEGCYIVENDFAALEFKIAALFWGDPKMLDYASDPNLDIHRDMAAECYACTKSEVNKDSRYCGKNGFVFPLIYGSYYCKIAQNMWSMIDSKALHVNGVPMREHLKKKGIRELGACNPDLPPRPGSFEAHIKNIEERFYKRFPVFAKAKQDWYEKYKKRGQFKLMTGFVCSGLFSFNQLLNTPIQGPGFHCCLLTLILIHRWIIKNKKKARILGQIHDCVVANVPGDELQEYLAEVKRIVEEELPKHWKWIKIKMGIEAEVTNKNWWHKKVWIEKDGKWQPKEV